MPLSRLIIDNPYSSVKIDPSAIPRGVNAVTVVHTARSNRVGRNDHMTDDVQEGTNRSRGKRGEPRKSCTA